jgi:hypothetical protein
VADTRFVRRLSCIALTLIVAGCGTTEQAAAPAKKSSRTCAPASVPGFRICRHLPSPTQPTIERRTPSGWKVVALPLTPIEPSAEWDSLSLSPDGKTLLAEWAYPCDSAAVVFIPAAGGRVRVATGERDWRKAPSARALGWTPAGKARIRTYSRWRGRPPGIYVIDPETLTRAGKPSVRSGC